MSGDRVTYSKTYCSFCKKIITRNGLGYVSHMRKHVREGIALEIGPTHHKYSGVIEFYNLRMPAKVGNIPSNIVIDKWSYNPKIGRKIKFRYDNDNGWINGVVDDINENCIFISLI